MVVADTRGEEVIWGWDSCLVCPILCYLAHAYVAGESQAVTIILGRLCCHINDNLHITARKSTKFSKFCFKIGYQINIEPPQVTPLNNLSPLKEKLCGSMSQQGTASKSYSNELVKYKFLV